MNKLLFIFIICLTTLNSYCQAGDKNSLQIDFAFKHQPAHDSNALTLRVIYKNNSKNKALVYKYLDEGYLNDRFFNINIELEKWEKDKYIGRQYRTYSNPLLRSMEDSLRHYDMPKKELLPRESDTLSINLLKVTEGFYPGKYRFRAHLRRRTIRNNSPYTDPSFETAPPEDKIEYILSKWFYFEIREYVRSPYTIKRSRENN